MTTLEWKHSWLIWCRKFTNPSHHYRLPQSYVESYRDDATGFKRTSSVQQGMNFFVLFGTYLD